MKNIDKNFKEHLEYTDQLPQNTTFDPEKNWLKFQEKYFTKRTANLKIVKYAAAVLIPLLIVTYLFVKNGQIQYTEITTGQGEKTMIKLGEGCTIWLNSNTKIKYPARYTKKTMLVTVEGEAYFSIEEARKNPIVIVAENTSTYVYESAFNIRAIPTENNIEITATKGNIKLGVEQIGFNGKLSFDEGERVSINRAHNLIFQEKNPDKNVLAWKTGMLEFNEAPLHYVVDKLERLYEKEIIIKPNYLKSKVISVRYNIDDLEKILQEISKKYNLQYTKNNTGYILYEELSEPII